MHVLVQLMASAHTSLATGHHVVAVGGLHGIGRLLVRRLLLHTLLRGGGWLLVLIVVAVLIAASQISRRR